MIDSLIGHVDQILRTLCAPAHSVRPVPGADLPEADLSDKEKRHVAALMRINHAGEICAQALYHGQAWTSKDATIKAALHYAACEETEHLAWTEQRIVELGGRKSLLNPLWYAGSLAIGTLAGKWGDRWNLGFLAETERQVEAHLASHLKRLPPQDHKSWTIIEQMKADESEHANTAHRLGAQALPLPIKIAMSVASKIMTKTAYWI